MLTQIAQHSPCNKDCHIDPESHFCKGCFRTIDEIVRWPYISEEEREKIFLKIEARRNNRSDHKSS